MGKYYVCVIHMESGDESDGEDASTIADARKIAARFSKRLDPGFSVCIYRNQ